MNTSFRKIALFATKIRTANNRETHRFCRKPRNTARKRTETHNTQDPSSSSFPHLPSQLLLTVRQRLSDALQSQRACRQRRCGAARARVTAAAAAAAAAAHAGHAAAVAVHLVAGSVAGQGGQIELHPQIVGPTRQRERDREIDNSGICRLETNSF